HSSSLNVSRCFADQVAKPSSRAPSTPTSSTPVVSGKPSACSARRTAGQVAGGADRISSVGLPADAMAGTASSAAAYTSSGAPGAPAAPPGSRRRGSARAVPGVRPRSPWAESVSPHPYGETVPTTAKGFAMLDHLSLQVRDVPRSAAFYDAVLAPLGAKRMLDL